MIAASGGQIHGTQPPSRRPFLLVCVSREQPGKETYRARRGKLSCRRRGGAAAALLLLLRRQPRGALGVGTGPASAHAAGAACEQAVVKDWSDDGRVDGTYTARVLPARAGGLPPDMRDYSMRRTEIERALAVASNRPYAAPDSQSRTTCRHAAPPLVLEADRARRRSGLRRRRRGALTRSSSSSRVVNGSRQSSSERPSIESRHS